MEQPAKNHLTPEQYLIMEEAAEYKSEYYQGEVYNMSGASINHNRIIRNISSVLSLKLSKLGCEAFTLDLRLWISSHRLFTYPDIFIICDKPQFYQDRDDTLTNPLIIFEVLSKSTENYDRGKKFLFYRSIPTFKEYILVDQNRIHVEQFNINPGNKWQLTEYDDVKEQLQLKTVDVLLSLKDIYSQVEF